MQMIEPITGKVEKIPDQLLPSAPANWVMARVNPAPAIMRAGWPHQTCSRSSSEGGARGKTNRAPRNAVNGKSSSQRELSSSRIASSATRVQIAKLIEVDQNQFRRREQKA